MVSLKNRSSIFFANNFFLFDLLRVCRRGSCCIGGERCLSRRGLGLSLLFRLVVVRGLRWVLGGGCLGVSCRLGIRTGYISVRSVLGLVCASVCIALMIGGPLPWSSFVYRGEYALDCCLGVALSPGGLCFVESCVEVVAAVWAWGCGCACVCVDPAFVAVVVCAGAVGYRAVCVVFVHVCSPLVLVGGLGLGQGPSPPPVVVRLVLLRQSLAHCRTRRFGLDCVPHLSPLAWLSTGLLTPSDGG